MRIVAFSDTHGNHRSLNIPNGDVLIFAGDMSTGRKLHHIEDFVDFISSQSHKYKIVIAGNHDFSLENEETRNQTEKLITDAGIIYLNDSEIVFEGVKFWGSPITPTFFNWAFNRDRGEEIIRHWDKIPSDTDVLITHGPPQGILDLTSSGQHVGCSDLGEFVKRVKPKVHIFGHIHEARGDHITPQTQFYNVSCSNTRYEYSSDPTVIDY